jgi:hypothetical protein
MTDKIEPPAEAFIAQGQAAAKQAELDVIAKEAIEFEKDLKAKLRENGKLLGISFAPNTSVESMHNQLKEARELIVQEPLTASEADAPESEHAARKRLRDENLRLIRIRIACLNPNKSGLPGEILTVHNDIVGTVKKYIPYNEAGEAYHVPYILLKMLKRKKFLQIKDPPKPKNGVPSGAPTTKMVPEYGIEILEPLTPRELDDLKRAQGAAEAADE